MVISNIMTRYEYGFAVFVFVCILEVSLKWKKNTFQTLVSIGNKKSNLSDFCLLIYVGTNIKPTSTSDMKTFYTSMQSTFFERCRYFKQLMWE